MMKEFLLICFLCLPLLINSKLDPIELVEPEKTGGMPVNEALSKRKTSRNFVDKDDLSIQELSTILWACYGPNRESGLKTAPSARGVYPFELYVFLRTGIYTYDIEGNTLQPYLQGDYRANTGEDPFVGKESMDVCVVSKLLKDYPYEKHYLNIGYCMENMYLYCASDNLKCCARGTYNGSSIMSLLNLDQTKYGLILCFSASKS